MSCNGRLIADNDEVGSMEEKGVQSNRFKGCDWSISANQTLSLVDSTVLCPYWEVRSTSW